MCAPHLSRLPLRQGELAPKATEGIERRSPDAVGIFYSLLHNPSVSFADSPLYTKGPLVRCSPLVRSEPLAWYALAARGAFRWCVHRHTKRFPKQKGTLTPNDWDESTVHTSWCHPSSKSFALPLCRSFRGGVRRFREILLYARSADVLHAYARRNLSASDFLSARALCALLLPCRCGYEVWRYLLSGAFWT